MPDITQTAWGDCVAATAQLNGGTHGQPHSRRSVDHLAVEVPVASHLQSDDRVDLPLWHASPDHVDYSSAHVVGSHCYTVLGWAYRDCQRWIVLRNPWGNTEATASVLDATISMYDVSWWRPITLKAVDGVFAMEIGAFKKYFAGAAADLFHAPAWLGDFSGLDRLVKVELATSPHLLPRSGQHRLVGTTCHPPESGGLLMAGGLYSAGRGRAS